VPYRRNAPLETPRPPRPKTGPGVTAHGGVAPEVLAARLAALQAASKRSQAERKAAAAAWLEACSGMPLEELRRSTPARLWTVGMLYLGGYDAAAIARAVGYTREQAARKALKHPAVVRLVELVRAAQLERVMRGEFGVAAQAKAAAPAVMEHLTELAGARKDRASGERLGRARRDADAIRAADLVLTTSGDKVVRSASYQIHVLEQLSDAELEAFSTRGEWPERLERITGALPAPDGAA
jgi:hypothetical protein